MVSNVQRFSLHDGPGIRTTVFLKACSLHCPWCANPENISGKPEKFKKNGQVYICGRYFTEDELYEILMRDKIYYRKGGITFSGGEPLLQIEKYEKLLVMLKEASVHICAETSLFIHREKLDLAIKYFDLLYVDIKILDNNKCRQELGGCLEQYVNNLKALSRSNIEFVVRMPIIAGYTDDMVNIHATIELLKSCKIDYIELLREHHMGMSKYDSIDKERPHLIGVSDKTIEKCLHCFIDCGINAKLLQA